MGANRDKCEGESRFEWGESLMNTGFCPVVLVILIREHIRMRVWSYFHFVFVFVG
jgi:hypothetical protein